MNIPEELTPLLDSKGKFSAPKIKKCEIHKSDPYDFIVESTNFVNESRSLFDRIKFITHEIKHDTPCLTCNSYIDVERMIHAKSDASKYCSMKCSKGRVKYGPNSKPQTQETKDRRAKTMLEKYGSRYNSQRPDVKPKLGNHFKDPEFITSNIKKLKDFYGVKYDLLDINEIDNKLESGIHIKNICDELNCSEIFLRKHLNKNNMYLNDYKGSQPEIKIRNIVSNLGLEFKNNDRSLKKEMDIYIPSHNFAIEVNGIYWHSVDPETCTREDINRHIDKTLLCESNGIYLMQFWESEINDSIEIVESMIKSKLGLSDTKIYARNCTIKDVPNKEAHEFIKANHLSRTSPVASIKRGLYYQDELVMIITLSVPRYNKEYDYEIIRSCSKLNTNVIGGFSKLLNTLNGVSLISYADRRYSNGNSYSKNGFTLLKSTSPGFKWLTPKGLEHRLKYKNGCGYKKLYDCGNYVFIRNKKENLK